MIVWTDYFKYRAGLRGFDLTEVEKILSFGDERYFDTATEETSLSASTVDCWS
jgi:hypothetical protein